MAPVKDSVNSFTLHADVSLRIGMFLFAFGVHSRHECCIILKFIRRVTSISCAVTCVTTEMVRNVKKHRGHALNKQSDCQQTCPTCEIHNLHKPSSAFHKMIGMQATHFQQGHPQHTALSLISAVCDWEKVPPV